MKAIGKLLFCVLLVSNVCVGAEKITVPLISGMTIKTDDGSLQTVKVTGRSLGPGTCSVTVEGGGETIGLVLLPGTEIPWADLFSPATGGGGVSCYEVTYDVGCDTGVLMKISYYTDKTKACR